MIETIYDLRDTRDIVTPALVYYLDIIQANANEAIRVAGGAERLWPHIKTHKMAKMIELLMGLGVRRFKTATIAESEMAARAGAPDVLMSYPLVGPNIARFLRLTRMYPDIRFWAMGDDLDQLRELSRQAEELGIRQRALVDVDLGMHRTGVQPDELEAFYREAAALPGLELRGLHCYDGHNNQSDPAVRAAEVERCVAPVMTVKDALEKDGLDCGVMIMGGTPSFPCHAATPGTFLSPGTLFVHDHGYGTNQPDMQFTPAGILLSRVVSTPCADRFTIDLGHKGIAADPSGARGVIANLPETEPLGQSEEHWVFRMLPGHEAKRPKVGDILYVIPTHICPTSALYPSVPVAKDGGIVDTWEVSARNRALTV